MKTDVENIKECIDKISNRYSDLIQKKVQLDAMWDGPASELFKKTYDDDLMVLMMMISNLQKLYSYENMAKECYQLCENQVYGVISDI